MRNFWHFIQYHNAVPLAVTIMVMGAGATFAATDPQAIYSAQQQVVSIDNTYLVNKDLSAYTPTVQITGVTEDADNYYVGYNFSTIDLDTDSVWKDVVKSETMTVSKADLGPYRDLGVYVTQQLKQNVDRELARLKETQEIEKKNVTQKTVATTYGGLVGKFLDSNTETLPGYTPVVTGPPPSAETAAAAGSTGGAQTAASSGGSESGTFATAGSSSGNPSLRVQLLGNNPAQIPLKAAYEDLGAIATDAANDNIRIETYLDGVKVPQIDLDTSSTSHYVVRYVALDPHDNSASVDRTIYVYDPAVGPPVPASQVQNAGNATPPPAQTETPPAPAATSTGPTASTSSGQASSPQAPAPTTPPPATTPSAATSTTTGTPPAATSTPAQTPPAATSTPQSTATTTSTTPASTTSSATTTSPADTSATTTAASTAPPNTSASSTAAAATGSASSTPASSSAAATSTTP